MHEYRIILNQMKIYQNQKKILIHQFLVKWRTFNKKAFSLKLKKVDLLNIILISKIASNN